MRATIRIAMVDGSVRSTAPLAQSGVWAAHPGPVDFQRTMVTHVPTGCAIAVLDDRDAALELVDDLGRDWPTWGRYVAFGSGGMRLLRATIPTALRERIRSAQSRPDAAGGQ